MTRTNFKIGDRAFAVATRRA